jgi:hypothetical protein
MRLLIKEMLEDFKLYGNEKAYLNAVWKMFKNFITKNDDDGHIHPEQFYDEVTYYLGEKINPNLLTLFLGILRFKGRELSGPVYIHVFWCEVPEKMISGTIRRREIVYYSYSPYEQITEKMFFQSIIRGSTECVTKKIQTSKLGDITNDTKYRYKHLRTIQIQ